ncbi:hypothetical protein Q1695_001402 [Nippostrongylus brasiliensis]|nr:hypothetical protein Q1695_001402 [Nippostrongylus brasiliensis]
MRLRTALLLALVVVLAIGCDGAREKSRKKNRDKSRADDSELGEEGGRGFRDEGLTNKERERERERERLLEKGERKKEEEESSEEDDDDKKEKNATNTDEIVIPEARFRRSHYDESRVRSGLRYKRFKNEGENSMGTVQMTRSKELNDGKSILLEDVQNKPAYKPQRFRRWPLPSKRTNHRQLHKKLGDSGKKKTKVQANHRARRLRRAEQEYEPEQSLTPMSKSESTDETSSSEERPKTRRVRSFANRGLIPRGKPSPYDTQSEEVLERDKTLKSIYPFQFL